MKEYVFNLYVLWKVVVMDWVCLELFVFVVLNFLYKICVGLKLKFKKN